MVLRVIKRSDRTFEPVRIAVHVPMNIQVNTILAWKWYVTEDNSLAEISRLNLVAHEVETALYVPGVGLIIMIATHKDGLLEATRDFTPYTHRILIFTNTKVTAVNK